MIGKVTVTTKNPPCRDCGGMAGYHSPRCPRKRAKSRNEPAAVPATENPVEAPLAPEAK